MRVFNAAIRSEEKPGAETDKTQGEIACRHRLGGGMLQYYYQDGRLIFRDSAEITLSNELGRRRFAVQICVPRPFKIKHLQPPLP
jgi:hypothetical protein